MLQEEKKRLAEVKEKAKASPPIKEPEPPLAKPRQEEARETKPDVQAEKEKEAPISRETDEEYRVKALDTISIKVYGEEDLSGDYKVQKGGFIDMPLLRKIQVEGLTVYEIEDKITSLLGKDYLVEPQVMINVKEYHSEKIVILGQVTKPGTYELATEEPSTLLKAISMAGGFTNVAAVNSVKIIRVEKGKKITITINANEIIDGKKEDVLLKTGDMIVVPDSFW
jgi:polysaccharide export outer membrane protein